MNYWNTHVANCIVKAKKALFALRLLRKYFKTDEMRVLLDANFYSVLYYNAVIWLTPDLGAMMKQNLISVSANALRSCLMYDSREISFENVHIVNKKCTPKQIMMYLNAIKLYKFLNENPDCPNTEMIRVLEQMVFTRRQINFEILRTNKTKIGMNSTENKFYYLNKQIGLDKLNLTFVHYKKLMKIQFLKNGKT